MATYRARLVHEPDGGWIAASVELPNTWSRGRTSEDAIEKLRSEIRYRIELCPCSGVADDFVQIEVQPAKPARGAASVAEVVPPSATSPTPARPGTWATARAAEPATFRGIAGCPPARADLRPDAAVANPTPSRRRFQSRWPD